MIVSSPNITTTLSTAIKDLDPDALIGGIREGIYDALSEALSQEEPEEAVVQTIVDEVCHQVDTLFQKRHRDVDTSVLVRTLRGRVMDIMGGQDYEDDEKWA